jgi:hypothetical protein
MSRGISRRVIITGAAAAISGPAVARRFGGGLSGGGGGQTITDIMMSGTTFLATSGNAGTFIGTATVVLSPSSPAAPAVTWSFASTGDFLKFSMNSSTGDLSIAGTDIKTPATYNITIIGTRAGYAASPFSKAEMIFGVSRGLTVNQNVTRPLGVLNFTFGSPNDYPFASIIAAVAGGPANPTDHLQFWSGPTGYVGVPWYLNNSPSPPVRGVSSASNLMVPSVQGTVWNPSGSDPPTPPVTSWELRFVNGATNAVIATQPIRIDILKRTNIFPVLSATGFNSSGMVMILRFPGGGVTGGASVCPIVAGESVQVECTTVPANGGPFPDINSMTIRFTIDDVPVGPILTGPQGPGFSFTIDATIDTTTLTDGTHALGTILIDHIGGSVANVNLPYYFRCVQVPFIVHNTGASLATVYAGSMRIPTIDRGFGPSFRLHSSKLDFVTFPGFTAIPGTDGTHNTVVPIPSPQSGFIPPASDPSSPLHWLTPTQQRNAQLFFTEGITGAIPQEYCTAQRFFTTVNGGVYAYAYSAELQQVLEVDYHNAIRHCNYDGGRNDSQTDPISSPIDGHDGTYWVVFEEFGRIIKVTFDGAATTIAGGTTNRAKLGFCVDDANYTEADLNTVLTQIGTIGSPSFGDLRGINDGCWDLRDPTPGNTLLVANAIDHYIAKITGLVSGPVTMTRIAGQDGGLGGAQINVADNGGLVDGPATEFVPGASAAIFVGSVSGGVLTVVSGYTVTRAGGLQAGCPLSWSPGNLNTTTGNMVTAHISGSGNGSTWRVNFATSSGNQSMTASQPVALLAGPYSIKMCDGVHGPDPLGTTYIADYQNSAIRRISADGNTLTTLVGNQLGAMRWDSTPGHGPAEVNAAPLWSQNNSSTPITISAATWAAGVLTVQTVAPVVAVQVSPNTGTIAPYWTITLAGLTNTGSGGAPAVNGNFQVISVSPGAQQFTLAMPAGNGVIGTLGGFGSANVVFWSDDVYLPSAPGGRSLDHGLATEAYCPLPQRLVINSTGKLVVVHTWFDAVTTIDLTAGTISYTGQYGCTVKNTRLNPDGSRANTQLNFQISWVGIDVDSGVAGDVSSTGCIGPKDDIIMLDSNGNIESNYWRMAADGTSAGIFSSDDMVPRSLMPVGRQGGGHYSWMIGISRHQARMLTSGVSDSGINGWRAINPAVDFFPDPPSNLFADGAALVRGYQTILNGTPAGTFKGISGIPGVFPWGIRPGITQTHGESYRSELGLPGHADSIDGLQAMFPTDAALTTFLQEGGGGVVPAPEFTGDDLKDIIYTIRRTSVQGSIPAPISSLVQRATYETDVTAPIISGVSASRTGGGTTTINMTWTTDKPTWGVVCAGFASAHGTTVPYHLFAREAFVAGAGNPSYGTSHSVTIQCYQDELTYLVVIAKDLAGNNAISGEQTVGP